MNKKFIDWFIFIMLSLIWGSSFILMKFGLQQLSSYQVAACTYSIRGAGVITSHFKIYKWHPKE